MRKSLSIIIVILIIAVFGVVWWFSKNEVQKPTVTDLIRITTPRPNQTISSPLIITGEARGNWYFEASFPVVLTNWDGLIIAQGIATAQSDWMTTDFVPFEATLTFTVDKNIYSNRGSLILRKDNPSGLPEHDDALEIPIIFSIPDTSGGDGSTGILPFKSGAMGKVLLGPICPVQKDPPDPNCADKGYVTTVQVIEKNSAKSSLFSSVETDKEGNYKVMLPPGEYSLQALGGQPFPTCGWKDITIGPDTMIEVDLLCDTGIR